MSRTADAPVTNRKTPDGAPESPLEAEGRRLGQWMALPTQILLVFIVVFPLLMQLYISVTDWTPLYGESWVQAWRSWNGFANYGDVLSNGRFWSALWRTLLVILVAATLPVPNGILRTSAIRDRQRVVETESDLGVSAAQVAGHRIAFVVERHQGIGGDPGHVPVIVPVTPPDQLGIGGHLNPTGLAVLDLLVDHPLVTDALPTDDKIAFPFVDQH